MQAVITKQMLVNYWLLASIIVTKINPLVWAVHLSKAVSTCYFLCMDYLVLYIIKRRVKELHGAKILY